MPASFFQPLRNWSLFAAAISVVGLVAMFSSGLWAFDDVPPIRQGMLLLKSGKVVSGEINQVAGGYLLKRPSGDVLIPFEQVHLEGASLRDVYTKQRDLLTPDDRTATNHILLARWCLSYQLYEEAQDELRDAIRLEPRRTEARILLKRLQDNILDPVTTETLSSDSDADDSRGNVVLSDGSTRPIQSLAGLTRENALTYVRSVQPILMNRCGNASCHGKSAGNGFQLDVFPYGQGIHRVQDERNLAEVMKFIDVQNPRRSSLLTQIANAHGPEGISLFVGSKGKKQQAILRNWVTSISREKQKSAPALSDLVQQASTDSADSPRSARTDTTLGDAAEEDGELVPPELLPDPFDPDAFNRMYHSGAIRSAVFETSPPTIDEPRPLSNDGNRTRLRLR